MENQNQQTQTPPQTPEGPTQILSVNNSSSNSKLIVTILGIVSVAIISIIAYFLITKQNQTIDQEPATTSPTYPQPSPTPFPATPQVTLQQKSSDVLTYNASYWSISYPQGWTIQKDTKNIKIGTIFFFEPQKKAYISVLPVKLSVEELNKVSSKEKIKEFMLQAYGITGITYVREENSPLTDKNEIEVTLRLITTQKDFDGISDFMIIKNTFFTIDFFMKTALSDKEKKSLQSFYNEKILSTFVGE